jgi:hypothetical protein
MKGISKQSILLLQNLYQNAKSYIKWNGQISEEFFIIEQGVRQEVHLLLTYIKYI